MSIEKKMKNLFNTQKHTTDVALNALLDNLKVKVTRSSSEECVQNHPNYPSILAIGSCLTDWGIENNTYRIDKKTYRDDLLFPFVAHFPEKGGRFVLVTDIKDQQVYYSDELTKNGMFTEEEFLKRWNGIALYAEPTSESGEKDYAQNRFKELLRSLMPTTAILCLGIIIWLTFANQPISWAVLSLSFLKFSGVGISILLLMQSLNANNPFVKNLCSLGGKNDCNAILKSDAAKLTSWLSWSEVGFFYFTGSLLSLLFAPMSFPILAWLNLFALPYTIYSISYQYRNKNWCVLCCCVQAILVLEAVTFLITKGHRFTDSIASNFSNFGLVTLVSFLLPILIWSFLKPFFTHAAQIKSLNQQLKKFKYNSDLFNQALKNQPRYAIGKELMPISLGNPEAETVITMVSNPFCGPCAKAHQTIDEWLKYRDDIQLKVIFTTADEENDPRTKVSRHLSALSTHEDKRMVENAMNDWYNSSRKNYEEWAVKYPMIMTEAVAKVTQNQKSWCDMAEITFTPTIFVNGYKLPDPYRLEDIKHLID